MLIQGVNNQEATKVFVVHRNMSGGTMNANAGVCFDLGTTVDGVSSIAPDAGSTLGWIGITHRDVGDTGYSLAQIWGFRDSVLLSHEGTSVTVTIGDALHLVSGVSGLNTSTVEALSTMGSKHVALAETSDLSAAAYVGGIIRCL